MLKGMKGSFTSLILVLLVAFGGTLLLSTSASAQESDVDALFAEGVKLYNRGRTDEALNIFKQVLAANPSNEEALRFLEEAGNKVFLQMLVAHGEYETVAKRFIELARIGRKEKEEDGSRIKELVAQVVSGDPKARADALLKLSADHGEFAVEYMYPELANEDLDARVNVITGLVNMGEEAVLPLVQVLHSEDVMIRRNAAAVLSSIRDRRALPALAAMAARDGDSLNRDVAAEGVRKIAGSDPSALPAPAELYLDLAARYAKRDEQVTKPYLPSRVVWSWRDGGLVKTPVYSGIRHLELAEDACYQALALQPGSTPARALLAFVYAAQKAEVAAARQAAEEGGAEVDDTVNAAAEKLAAADRLMALAGPDGLDGALQSALDLGYGGAAVEIMKVMEGSKVTGPALEKALARTDKNVRYHAAVALADLGAASDAVVQALAFALRETAVREILVIDDRSDSRNALINDLNGAGYFAVGAENGVQGLLRAKRFPLEDLVILRAGLKDMTTDRVIFELATGDTAKIPVILLADEGRLDEVKKTWEGKVAGFISSPPSKDVYLPVVKAAVGETLNPERAQAVAMSRIAAQALHGVDPARLAPYMEDLLAALDKPDEVKIPVLRVLEGIGDPAGLEKVKAIFGDESASVEVRAAAAGALGAMLARLGKAPDPDLLDLLAAAVGSDDPKLSAAAAAAAGKASGLAPDFVDGLLARYRID